MLLHILMHQMPLMFLFIIQTSLIQTYTQRTQRKWKRISSIHVRTQQHALLTNTQRKYQGNEKGTEIKKKKKKTNTFFLMRTCVHILLISLKNFMPVANGFIVGIKHCVIVSIRKVNIQFYHYKIKKIKRKMKTEDSVYCIHKETHAYMQRQHASCTHWNMNGLYTCYLCVFQTKSEK